MKKLLSLLALFVVLTAPAIAQPGPGPAPDPWVVNGSSISYNGCVLVPVSVGGGCKGAGTINATAIYQAGFQVLGTLANGKIFVGNASAVGIAQTPSGDLTMTNTGVFTISANVVTNAKLAQAAATTLKGNPTNATANVQDFTLSGLSALTSPNTTLDLLLVWDHTAGTFKSVTPLALGGINFEQASQVAPVIFDTFNYPDGTNISGLTVPSGNSTWSFTAQGTPTVENTYLTNSLGIAGNFYAALPNSSTVGGATVPVTLIGATVIFCQPLSGAPYDPTQQNVTVIAGDTTIANVIHLNFGPQSWSLVKRVSAGSFINLASAGYNLLSNDCKSEYQISMSINKTAGTVQVLGPDGVLSPVITDADITTINAQNGIWQILPSAHGAEPRIGAVWMGGPPQGSKYAALGHAAQQSDLQTIQGAGGTARHSFPTFTIPNAAGGGGTGWYRIATQANIVLPQLVGDFTITASDSIGQQIIKFKAAGVVNSSIPYLVQVENQASYNIIDQVRFSNDGTTNIALDVHISSAATTYANTFSILGVGLLTPKTDFPVGATSLTTASVISVTNDSAPYTQTLAGNSGWYTTFVQAVSANFFLRGTLQISATSSAGFDDFTIGVNGTTSSCDLSQISNSSTGNISQVRCSWNAGTNQIQLDFFKNISSSFPVTLSGIFTGVMSQNGIAPSGGATALSGGSTTLTLIPNQSIYDTFNAGIGFQVAGIAASGNVLRGNGTNFVSAALACGDLSNSGTACQAAVGTSGATVPFNNTANVFSALQTFTLNAGTLPGAIVSTIVRAANVDASISRIVAEGYGAIGALTVARADGTAASPTAVQSGDQIGGFNAYAWGSNAAWNGSIASMRVYAAENISGTAWGSKICWATTPVTTVTIADGLCQQNDAGVTIGAPTGGSKGAGTLNATGLYINGTSIGTGPFLPLAGGTMVGNLIFTDNTYDIGASGATRPRNLYISGLSQIAGSVAIAGATIGTNALAVTGTSLFGGQISITTGGITMGATPINNVSYISFFATGSGSYITSALANTIQIGPADSATPLAQILRFQSSNSVNVAGANTTLIGSLSAGSGNSGDIILQTGVKSNVSGTQATPTTALTIKGESQNVVVAKQFLIPAITSDATQTDAAVCVVTGTGQLYYGTGTLGVCLGTSSARFKQLIEPQQDGLAQIIALRSVNYFYREGYGDGGAREQYGFLAEDVVHVLPKLVGLDAEGRPNSVDILGMTPILVRAVQELKNDNDNLRQEIEALKRAASR